ncbi:MAG: aldehyde dehydrogenase family protein, partial [Proteobacteria bacterium]|nr:aldehyde dehydrogenase family protein [Pseudomonadota bacterium]
KKKIFINCNWVDTGTSLEVINPFDGNLIVEICQTSPQQVEEAIDSAYKAKAIMAKLTAKQRGDILDRTSAIIVRDAEEIAGIISREAGKGIALARGEVERSGETFKFAADEARRLSGELIPFDAAASGANRFGYYKRYPLGVIGAIAPFNFPLNLVAHKVSPAIAAGCPLVLKPASNTPLTSVKLVEILLEAGLPPEGINLVVGSGSTVGNAMVQSDKINMITFTGSPAVGLEIKKKAGMKMVTLELGSNSAAIFHKDADLQTATPRCIMGSFAFSGQVCISLQRIYIHEDRYDEFRQVFLNSANSTTVGDPADPSTMVGPMIEEKEATRVENWVNEAIQQGASVIAGGKREGSLFYPTVIENTNAAMKVVSEELFAPVVCLMKYSNMQEAIEMVNDSKFGLQAGVFTSDINAAFKAIDGLEVGGVMVNDVPTFRVDQMPYGGVKLSGMGREGAKFAIEEMTELRTVMINLN